MVLFLAAQFIDLLWPTFLLLGFERVRIAPGATTVTPLLFEHYPFSHSLVAVVGWAALIGGLYFYLRRQRLGALVIGVLVLSHWVLDLLVHRPDLPLVPNGGPLVGFGAWSSLALTLLIEVPLYLAIHALHGGGRLPRSLGFMGPGGRANQRLRRQLAR